MGLFGDFFGGNSNTPKAEKQLPWIALNTADQLEALIRASRGRTQIIFKHSDTCGISRMVLGMFSEQFPLPQNGVDLYFLDIHSYRPVSNAVAAKLNVIHESPQLLILRNEEVVYHNSHGAIVDTDLQKYM